MSVRAETISLAFALVALAVFVSARPDPNDSQYKGSKSINNAADNRVPDVVQIPKQSISASNPDRKVVYPGPIKGATGIKEETPSKTSSEVIPENNAISTKPVNVRFPHSVLFGGTCGGSIIHPKWILTAGHCTLFTGGRYVLAGTNNSDNGSGVTKKVKKLYVHPLFTVGPYWLNARNYDIKQVAARWDFMLAELEEPLELDNVTIAAVTLDDQTTTSPDTVVGYAGYGAESHGGYMRSDMHAMSLKTQPDSVCQTLRQYNSEDMLCAKGYAPNFDSACNGDSGSGLVDGNRLLGVASWVQNDAFECAPGNIVYFSRVGSARDWIREVTGV